MIDFNDEDEPKMVWPPTPTDALSISLDLDLPRKAVAMMSERVFKEGLGTLEYDEPSDSWLIHLPLMQRDRDAAHPFLIGVTDMWLGIRSKTVQKDPA